jgi:hypothetical protein
MQCLLTFALLEIGRWCSDTGDKGDDFRSTVRSWQTRHVCAVSKQYTRRGFCSYYQLWATSCDSFECTRVISQLHQTCVEEHQPGWLVVSRTIHSVFLTLTLVNMRKSKASASHPHSPIEELCQS